MIADGRTEFALKLNRLRGNRLDAPAYVPFFAPGKPPKTPTFSLQKIADINQNSIQKPENDSELVPYVGLPECTQTTIREVIERPYSEVKGRAVVRPRDILFARIEPSVFNQKYVLVEDLHGFEAVFTSTEFYVVTAKPDKVERDYLYAMFFCSFVFNQVKGKTTGSSGRRRLDMDTFVNLQIPVPDLGIQQAIATEMNNRRQKARQLRSEAEVEWQAAKQQFENQLLDNNTVSP